MFHIVLVEPEIPQNTGNIARTCAATGARLHIVKPMGFEIDDKKLKRAGLDYWHLLGVTYYENLDEFLKKLPAGGIFIPPQKPPPLTQRRNSAMGITSCSARRQRACRRNYYTKTGKTVSGSRWLRRRGA